MEHIDFHVSKTKSAQNEDNPIIREIRFVMRQIDAVISVSCLDNDSDLIESRIYELEALRARYRYLLKTARNERVVCGDKHVKYG